MKKRLVVFMIVLAVLAALVVFPANAAEDPSTIQAGYAKVSIDPSQHPSGPLTGLPMSGYGNTSDHLSGSYYLKETEKKEFSWTQFKYVYSYSYAYASTGADSTLEKYNRMDDNGDGKIDENDGLFATCIALTTQNGNTMLYIAVDLINSGTAWTIPLRNQISKETGVPTDNIFINASHTHSGPDITSSNAKAVLYKDWVYEQLSAVAKNAMADRKASTMTKGSIDASDYLESIGKTGNATRMNHVRHYVTTDSKGTYYGGSNFGSYDTSASSKAKMVYDPDDMMYLVQLAPQDGSEPIVLVNWRAHATMNSTQTTQFGKENYYKISSDYVNSLRYNMEQSGYRVAFMQGAAGNAAPSSGIQAHQDPEVCGDYDSHYKSGGDDADDLNYPMGPKYGKKLAGIALAGLKNMSDPLDTSFIRTVGSAFTYDRQVLTPEQKTMLDLLNATSGDIYDLLASKSTTFKNSGYSSPLVYMVTKSDGSAFRDAKEILKNEPGLELLKTMVSYRELSGYRGRMSVTAGSTGTLNIGAVAIGKELSLMVSTCELFDHFGTDYETNLWTSLNSSTFGTPLLMGYTNGGNGYVPNTPAYHYNDNYAGYNSGSYETFNAAYAEGTGEKLVAAYAPLLDIVNGNSSECRYQCECGGTAVGKPGHTCAELTYLPWSNPNTLPLCGNYYLTTDVTTTKELHTSETLRLDLNGHNITYKVALEENMRVLYLESSANVTITDSTGKPGTITRDLSALTADEKASITNYGLILMITGKSSATLYNGTLDVTGQYSGGGGAVSVFNANTTFTMYGGTIKGGISNNGGAMIVRGGEAFIYGGTITGGVTKTASGYAGGIYANAVDNICGKVTIGGDAQIVGNKKSNGSATNIRFANNQLDGNFTVTGKFTGKASIFIDSRTEGQIVGVSDNAEFTAENLSLDYYKDFRIVASDGKLILANPKTQCICGGKAVGMPGHTCKQADFLPWSDATSLPSSGNYYLTTSVTTSAQKTLTSALCLDLNGNDITYKVPVAQGEKAAAGNTHNTRVFYLNAGGSLSITDSSSKPGTITRDLSLLTQDQKNSITNYGLLVCVGSSENTGSFTMYNGNMDFSEQLTCGGTIANLNKLGSKITVYGGTVKGATSRPSPFNNDGGYAGGIYSMGPVELYGGNITGGLAQKGGAGVFVTSTGSLLLSGNATIDGNTKADGKQSNILATVTKITVKDTYTGTAGISISSPAAGSQLAVSSNANISGALLFVDNFPTYSATVSSGKIVLKAENVVQTTVNGVTKKFDTLAEAINNSTTGTVTLLANIDETLVVTAPLTIDLAGYSIGSNVTATAKITLLDSATDDFTVLDADGNPTAYGKIPASLTSAQAASGYLMVTEGEYVSFHRFDYNLSAVNLRPSSVGIYYTCPFGGDEIIQAKVESFGVALGALKDPDYSDKTYTVFTKENWKCGLNADGTAANQANGTILQGVMTAGATATTNSGFAEVPIRSVAYVQLEGYETFESPIFSISLREMFEGRTTRGIHQVGIDELWDSLGAATKTEVLNMYTTFQDVMSTWNIPNIKQAHFDANQDDGVLKILMVGHSLGVDSTYFLPEVLKAETGKDVVVGTLYHSGCRLNQHVSYLKNDSKEYAYLEYNTATDSSWKIWETEEGANKFVAHTPDQAHDVYIGATAASNNNPNKYGVTMEFGVKQHDWDIVVMQAGVFEAANKNDWAGTYSLNLKNDINTIQNYVNSWDTNKYTAPKFAWNMTWATPSRDSGLLNTSYENNLLTFFSGDSTAMYKAISDTLTGTILNAADWDYVFPSGTAVQNARSIMADTDVYRDTIHGSDFTRLMVAYTWYCELFDKHITDCKITSIGSALRQTEADRKNGDLVLSSADKTILRNAVQTAIDTPYNATQLTEDDGVTKVLVVGHSTGMDAAYFTPVVAAANGTDMLVADLYHSGCRLSQHETFIKNNAEEYVYMEYDNRSDTYWRIWQTGEPKLNTDGSVATTLTKGFGKHSPNQAHDNYVGGASAKQGNAYGVTMQFAIQQHDWDVVILMGGGTESIKYSGGSIDLSDIALIRKHVLENDQNKTTVPEFAWNMTWTCPNTENNNGDTYASSYPAILNNYFGGDNDKMYESIATRLRDEILAQYNFSYILANGTVVQNMKAAGLTDLQIYRDRIHATDLTRLAVACNWYSVISGKDITKMTIPSVQDGLEYTTNSAKAENIRGDGKDFTLTSAMKSTVVSVINKAQLNPFAITK